MLKLGKLFWLPCLLVIGLMGACSDDDDDEEIAPTEQNVVGTWEFTKADVVLKGTTLTPEQIKEAEEEAEKELLGNTMKINADKSGEWVEQPFTWSLNVDTKVLSLTFTDQSNPMFPPQTSTPEIDYFTGTVMDLDGEFKVVVLTQNGTVEYDVRLAKK
ncbi:hypothetical protein FUAX_11670 [Fulvitalea axinellae]|uniref:Lipocalin-like domain-containing protein n=1 Tax=Fulvitalea axinellae TaxID=1182444 RepID=A0AAU9CHK8_9BACT|nr:hypothetical protein FUAX_11670 [Fulvitalea axinellae]